MCGTQRMAGTCHQLFNLDNYRTFVSSTSIESEIHSPVLTLFQCTSIPSTASTAPDSTWPISIPLVCFGIPVIFAANIVSETRNVGETCSHAPVRTAWGRTRKQNPGLLHCESWCGTWLPLPSSGAPAPQFCPS